MPFPRPPQAAVGSSERKSMENEPTKLEKDLAIAAAMAAGMAEYLDSELTSLPLGAAGMPPLTLAGFLLRRDRLASLAGDQLSPTDQALWGAVEDTFAAALQERVVRTEAKAHVELGIRYREWDRHVQELTGHASNQPADYYPTMVESRVMLASLLVFVSQPPYKLDSPVPAQLSRLDSVLRRSWQPGAFVWAPAWARAYPRQQFWFLYGLPQSVN